MEGKLQVKDLPEYWNARYKEYLGIKVPNDAEGVLQDIHWSHGSIGYFPTYSLGSFYAAQFYATAKKEIKSLENKIESGNMLPLLEWLREKIHKHGKYYSAEELCKKVTGEKLNFAHFMNYAKEKYSGIYDF
jgi:carboxypeptidase Taq